MLLTVNIEQKLNKHVGDSVKQRDPGIQRLVKSYNDICIQIRHIAPRRAFLPCPLDMVGLYNLDVDDAIWHDRGLGEETEDNIAGWMSDENVHKGIKCLLDLDRCIEEEVHLKKEWCTLQEWLCEKWKCLQVAVENAGVSLLYFIC